MLHSKDQPVIVSPSTHIYQNLTFCRRHCYCCQFRHSILSSLICVAFLLYYWEGFWMVFDKMVVVSNKIVLSCDTVRLCSAAYRKSRTGQ